MDNHGSIRSVSDDERGRISLHEGLAGQDDNLDRLAELFELLQLCTVEVAHPELHVLGFPSSCFYFGIIMFSPPLAEDNCLKALCSPSAWYPTDWREGEGGRLCPSIPDDDPGTRQESTPLDLTMEMDDDDLPNLWVNYRGSSRPASPFSASDLRQPSPPTYDFDPQSSFSPPPTQSALSPHTERPVGIVYLTATPLDCGHDMVGELNIGIFLDKEYRGKGFGREVVQHVLTMAFEERRCHRVQAAVLDSTDKDILVALFTQLKFGHEGVRRLGHFDRFVGEWKDVTNFAILATDWVHRSLLTPAPKSLWDEMFARHAREREQLLRWEDRKSQIKRTSSMETILPSSVAVDPAPSISGDESDCQSVYESESEFNDARSHRSRSHSVASVENSDAESDTNIRSLDPFNTPGGLPPFSPSPRAWSPALSAASTPHTITSDPEVDSSWDSDASSEWSMLDGTPELSARGTSSR